MKRIDGIYKQERLKKGADFLPIPFEVVAAIMQDFMEPQMPHFIRLERRRRGF